MRSRDKYLTLFFASLFLLSFGVLVFLEGPFSFYNAPLNTSYFIPSDLLINDRWYAVYFEDSYIGYSHSFMKVLDVKEGGGYLLANKTDLVIPVLGVNERFGVETNIVLEKDYRLKSGRLTFSSSHYFLKGYLKRIKDDIFYFQVKTPSQTIEKTLSIPGQVVSSYFTPIFLNYLPPHRRIRVAFYDPVLERDFSITIIRKRRLLRKFGDKTYRAIEFSFNVEGVEGTIYTDDKGYLLEQDFLGFSFVKEEAQKIFKKKVSPKKGVDFAVRFSVPAESIRCSGKVRFMKVRISGVPLESIPESFNQKVYPEDGLVEVVQVTPYMRTDEIDSHKLKKYLGEDEFIRFKNREVEKLARKITASDRDDLSRLRSIFTWVDKNIKKKPVLSLPSPEDVLLMREGDCGEISAFMVGLLRSVGIPSYVNIGVVYQNGRFFYHAWVSAFVGNWFDTDPALSQFLADATHIKLAHGLEGQFEIFKFIDRLNIKVIDYKCGSGDGTLLKN